MQKITPCLWFDDQAEEAARFYASIFKNSKLGEKVECGWLKDRYGMSWQVVPSILPRMLTGPDPAGSARVLQSIMRMKKLDIEELKRAYGPKSA